MENDSLLRIEEVLKRIPVSRSAWYKGIRTGMFPAPIKFGEKVSLWRASAINDLINNACSTTPPPATAIALNVLPTLKETE